MSRSFDRPSEEYLEAEQSAFTGPPFTMACWFRPEDNVNSMILMSLADQDTDVNIFNLLASGNISGDPVRVQTRDSTGSVFAQTTSGYSLYGWYHACGVFASISNRRVFVNGGSKGVNNNTKQPTGIDRFAIGRVTDASPGGYFHGQIAEAAIWDTSLTDDEVAVLGAGYSPLFVRPQNLYWYWPLIRDNDYDVCSGKVLTPYNSPTVAAHCPVIRPAAPAILMLPVVEVGITPLLLRAIEKY
jgi:hypothetical protein